MKKKSLLLLLVIILCTITGCTCNVSDGKVYYGCYGALLPCYNNYYDIGSATGHWNTLYVNNVIGWTPPAGAGTGNVTAIPSGTAEYIPYFTSSTNIANSWLQWDAGTNRLGLGGTVINPNQIFEILEGTFGNPQLRLTYNQANAYTDLQTMNNGDFYINPSNDRVGINDNTPLAALDVTGTIHATGDIDNDSDINAGNDLTCINNLDVGDDITVGGNVHSNLIATANVTYDLGSATVLWDDLYVNTIHAGFIGGLSPLKIISDMDMNNYQIKNVRDPTDIYDVVTKNYGDTHYENSPPAWKGNIAGTYSNGDPEQLLASMQRSGVVSPTPTNITATVARISYFKLDTALTVNKIRWYGVGATQGIYNIAIYRNSDSARMTSSNYTITTAAATWGSVSTGGITLAANTLYFFAISPITTGTIAGILAMGTTQAATTGTMILPTNWPGNLDFDAASPKISPAGFAQFATTAGALPATAPTRVNQAVWTGGMPAFFLDNSNL